jgi:hypothetical protein
MGASELVRQTDDKLMMSLIPKTAWQASARKGQKLSHPNLILTSPDDYHFPTSISSLRLGILCFIAAIQLLSVGQWP